MIANSANEALDVVDAEPLDLIILDKNMPDMDGFTLIAKLKDRISNDEIPIVMVSADPKDQVMDDAIRAGAMAYISKPIRLDTLIELIRKYTTPDSPE
jgi:CheY-like chemotaxis protein